MRTFRHRFPTADRMGCYTHVACEVRKGEALGTRHQMYEFVRGMVQELHTCCTTGMWNVLTECAGMLFSPRAPALNAVWDQCIAEPHNDWHLGVTRVAGAVPSNNCQEVRCQSTP